MEYSGIDPTILENVIQLLYSAPLGKQSQLARKANDLYELQNAWRQWHSNLEYSKILTFINSAEKYKSHQLEMKLLEMDYLASLKS